MIRLSIGLDYLSYAVTFILSWFLVCMVLRVHTCVRVKDKSIHPILSCPILWLQVLPSLDSWHHAGSAVINGKAVEVWQLKELKGGCLAGNRARHLWEGLHGAHMLWARGGHLMGNSYRARLPPCLHAMNASSPPTPPTHSQPVCCLAMRAPRPPHCCR